jgi:hypothetical protein
MMLYLILGCSLPIINVARPVTRLLENHLTELRPLLLIIGKESTASSADQSDAGKLGENDANVQVDEHEGAYKHKAHEPAHKLRSDPSQV